MIRIAKRRRRENKTDYLIRMKLLKSEKPRIVFRKTNKYVVAQYVISKEAKDEAKMGITSKALMKYGWPKEAEGSLKSIPASYLTGYLIGIQIIKNKLETPIIDFGMHRVLHKSKLHAFLKGLSDSGVKIKCKEEAFPEQDRIKGKHMKKDFSKTFEEIKTKLNK